MNQKVLTFVLVGCGVLLSAAPLCGQLLKTPDVRLVNSVLTTNLQDNWFFKVAELSNQVVLTPKAYIQQSNTLRTLDVGKDASTGTDSLSSSNTTGQGEPQKPPTNSSIRSTETLGFQDGPFAKSNSTSAESSSKAFTPPLEEASASFVPRHRQVVPNSDQGPHERSSNWIAAVALGFALLAIGLVFFLHARMLKVWHQSLELILKPGPMKQENQPQTEQDSPESISLSGNLARTPVEFSEPVRLEATVVPVWATALADELREVRSFLSLGTKQELQTLRTDLKKDIERAVQEMSNGRSSPLPSQSPPASMDLSAIVAEARDKEVAAVETDRKDFARSDDELRIWTGRLEELRRDLASSSATCGQIVDVARRALAELPPDIRDQLHSRHQAVELILKMWSRLESNVQPSPSLPGRPLTFTDEDTLRSMLLNVTDEAIARNIVSAQLRLGATDRYQQMSQHRTAAEKARRLFFSFVTRQILPILDGLDEGERSSSSLIAQLKSTRGECAINLDNWFGSYSLLSQLLLRLLNKFDIHRMTITPGLAVNYEQHEPFEVESDPDLKTEQIKGVVRHGYEYHEQNASTLILRPAQVIVVKN